MTVRVTLAPTVSRFDFERFAYAHALRLHQLVERGVDEPYEEVWATDDQATAFHYVEDEMIAVAYVLVRGTDEQSLAEGIHASLETVEAGKAARQALEAHTKEERLRGISYLAASTPPEVDDELLGAFRDLFDDPDPDIRLGAVFASSYAAWPELDQLLERLRHIDPDPRLRDAAAQAITAIRRHRNGGTP